MQRIVVLMDRAVTAQAVAEAISAHHGLLVEAAATSLDEVAESVESPSVVVVDQHTPQSSAAMLSEVRNRWPEAAVVMLDGIATVEALVTAIRESTGDLTVLTASAVARARAQLRTSVVRPAVGVYARLTPREKEVLALLSAGASPASIAEQLKISVNTCRGYLRTLMAKLGARSQLEVVAFVNQHGLPDD
ncbi:MAG: response regulator transcription factor [Actinobacteria bacterium]|nr:response regulator transcription factor [Actinomycetota bacterium]